MKELIKYFKKRKEIVLSILEIPERDFTSANFHKLRVEIKKLNALYGLLNYSSEDFKRKKLFEPLKLLFEQAGKVRQLQLHEEMLTEYKDTPLPEEYRDLIKEQRRKEENIYFDLVSHTSMEELNTNFHKIVPFLTRIDNEKVKGYMEMKRNLITQSISPPILRKQKMHPLRKQLKELQYNMDSQALKKSNKPISNTDSLTELLGHWHDYQDIIIHLKKTIAAGELDAQALDQLKKIKSKFMADSKIVFSQIQEVLPASEFYDSSWVTKS